VYRVLFFPKVPTSMGNGNVACWGFFFSWPAVAWLDLFFSIHQKECFGAVSPPHNQRVFFFLPTRSFLGLGFLKLFKMSFFLSFHTHGLFWVKIFVTGFLNFPSLSYPFSSYSINPLDSYPFFEGSFFSPLFFRGFPSVPPYLRTKRFPFAGRFPCTPPFLQVFFLNTSPPGMTLAETTFPFWPPFPEESSMSFIPGEKHPFPPFVPL